jgi:hypothetical protein
VLTGRCAATVRCWFCALDRCTTIIAQHRAIRQVSVNKAMDLCVPLFTGKFSVTWATCRFQERLCSAEFVRFCDLQNTVLLGQVRALDFTKAATVTTKSMKVTCSLVSYGSYIKMRKVMLRSVSLVKLITRVCVPSVHYLLLCNLYNDAVPSPGYKASSPVYNFYCPKIIRFLLYRNEFSASEADEMTPSNTQSHCSCLYWNKRHAP